jgi:hypothetical protein
MCVILDPCSFRWRELHLERVRTSIQPRRTRKAVCRISGSDELQHRRVTHQRMAGPVCADQTKHAMLDRVPLRRTGPEERHRDRQLEFVGQSVQTCLPAPTALASCSTAIGLDQQLSGVCVTTSSQTSDHRRWHRRAIAQVSSQAQDLFFNAFASAARVANTSRCSGGKLDFTLTAPNRTLVDDLLSALVMEWYRTADRLTAGCV